MLAIEATDLTPIALGNADELKKGQIVISLGNPYAIARDGQASAAWGIVSNLRRKAPATPSESDPSGRPTLHHYGTPDPDRRQAEHGHQRRAAVESQGRDGGA